MLLIGQMSDDIREELEGAEHYYNLANKIKIEFPDMARRYIDMAKAELGHAVTIHALAQDTINKCKTNMSKETADYMEEYYEEAHDYFVKKFDELSYLLNRFTI